MDGLQRVATGPEPRAPTLSGTLPPFCAPHAGSPSSSSTMSTTSSTAASPFAACLFALALPTGALAAASSLDGQPIELPAGIEACAQVHVDSERLACYDRYVAPKVRGAVVGPAASSSSPGAPVTPAAIAAARPAPIQGGRNSILDEYWELAPERKRGTFNFDGYRPNYFFPLHVTSGINRNPRSPAAGHDGSLPDYDRHEAKLQLSVRTKLWEDVGVPGGDLWFAYTQQSLWQLYSGGLSRPFRATDHEPELFYIAPIRYELPLRIKLQMAGIGIAHQSNGQTLPLSRSWNRTYALVGLEKGPFALTVRQNWRLHESDDQDDNPDLTAYRGRTELLGLWTPGFMTASALWKTNFDTRRGSLQLDWTMPVRRSDPKGLRYYVQVFTGYGETLTDYNFRQTSVGAGLSLFGW